MNLFLIFPKQAMDEQEEIDLKGSPIFDFQY